jgi:hypothetical protein
MRAYILVGGLAVDLCGFARSTEDVDIIVNHSPENIKKMLACLTLFGEGSARELTVEDFTVEEGCIRVVEDFPVDIFVVMSGYTYADLLKYSAVYNTKQNVSIRHLNAQGIMMLKKDSLRPKDRIDIEALLSQMKQKENQ